jgi:hypothetical protein
MADPELEDWGELYTAMAAFAKLRPWGWMEDDQVFGVREPDGTEIGWCCVMGGLDELAGLAVYRGARGWSVFQRLVADELSEHDEYAAQDLLLATMGDREDLTSRDRAVIRRLGLTFRGRGRWPCFRSQRPGYAPWDVDAGEARWLAAALRQTVDVAIRVRDDPELLERGPGDALLVRERTRPGGRMMDAYIEPESHEVVLARPDPDQVRLGRIRAKCHRGPAVWEAEVFHIPAVVQERRERPFFPATVLVVDVESELVLRTECGGPEPCPEEFANQILSTIEDSGSLPRAIVVDSAFAESALAAISDALEIAILRVPELRVTQGVRASMVDFLAR